MIGLFKCPITGVQYQTQAPINNLRKNRVLNEPIRFEETVSYFLIINSLIQKSV